VHVSETEWTDRAQHARSPRLWKNIQLRNALSAIYLFTARVIVSVVQLRYVERIWGGSYSGLNVLSNQIVLYVTLLEFGLAQAALSFLYEPIVRGDNQKASALVLAVRHDVRKLISVGAVVLFPLLALYARAIHAAVPFATIVETLWLIALTGLLQLATVHYQVYLNAAERLGWVNLIFGTGFMVKTAIGLSLAVHFGQYLWLPGSTAMLTLAELWCLKKAFHRAFPHFRDVNWIDAAQSIRQRARFVLIHKVAGLAYYQSDFIVLSLTTSLLVVKDYAKYQYVSAALLSMVGAIAAALTSSFARVYLRHAREQKWRRYVAAQFTVALLGAILMLGFWFTAPAVVSLAFGSAPSIGWFALGLFGLALFLNIVKATDDVVIIAKGAFKIGFWIPIIEVPIYILLGVLLSRRFGFCGVLLASIATNLIVSIATKGVVLANEVFDTNSRKWFLSRARNTAKALALASPLIPLYFIAKFVIHSPIIYSVAWGGVAILYSFLLIRLILPGLCANIAAPQMRLGEFHGAD
jgi:O-antigen/teichoic acid export membrane protein